jgi:hypothetical protein
MLKDAVAEYLARYKCATLSQLERYTRVSRLTLRIALCDLMLEHGVVHMRVANAHVFCTKGASYTDAVEAAMKSAGLVPRDIKQRLRELIEKSQGRTVYISAARLAESVYRSPRVVMLLHEYIKALLNGAVTDVIMRGRNMKTLFVIDREKALAVL